MLTATRELRHGNIIHRGTEWQFAAHHINSHVEMAKAGDVLYELVGNEAHECCLKKQASFRTTAYYHNFVRTDNECICMNECKIIVCIYEY